MSECKFKSDGKPDPFVAIQLRTGFVSAVRSILKMKPQSLATIGMPCSSFVFLNAGTSKRSTDTPLGRESLPYIARANASPSGIN